MSNLSIKDYLYLGWYLCQQHNEDFYCTDCPFADEEFCPFPTDRGPFNPDKAIYLVEKYKEDNNIDVSQIRGGRKWTKSL